MIFRRGYLFSGRPGTFFIGLWSLLLAAYTASAPVLAEEEPALEKSAYFAFVGHEFIFTIEMVKPGTPLLNFVSLSDRENKLEAKNVLLFLGNRKVATKLFFVDSGPGQQPIPVSSMQMHPRSSFGFRLQGSFGDAAELHGAEIRIGQDKFKLAPLSEFDFETLVRKVNLINLESPDFRDDYRVLKLENIGARSS
jgi:hypothetical protein